MSRSASLTQIFLSHTKIEKILKSFKMKYRLVHSSEITQIYSTIYSAQMLVFCCFHILSCVQQNSLPSDISSKATVSDYVFILFSVQEHLQEPPPKKKCDKCLPIFSSRHIFKRLINVIQILYFLILSNQTFSGQKSLLSFFLFKKKRGGGTMVQLKFR